MTGGGLRTGVYVVSVRAFPAGPAGCPCLSVLLGVVGDGDGWSI